MPTRRIPVTTESGDTVGWVMFDALSRFVKLDKDIQVPAEFHLRFAGDGEQPSLLISYNVRSDGAPLCTAVTVEAKPDGRQVMRKDFETITKKLREWSDMAVKAVMQTAEESDTSLTLKSGATREAANRAASKGRRRANQKIDDALKREVAALYRDNIDTGVYKAIRERYGCSQPTAARYVLLAREAGYLPATENGVKKA